MLGWAEEIVDAITYKPGWKFKLDNGALIITATVLHSETLKPVTFDIRRRLPRHLTTEQIFVDWVEDMVHEAEHHETREFFKYRGELWSNPHASEPA